MQLRAIQLCLKNVDFPMSRTYVTTYIKALLLVRRKKEKEFFCGPNDTPMYPFFSPTPSSLDGEGTDKLYGIEKRQGRDSKSKGNIKSCRCVSRAQQRGRCQKRFPRDSIGDTARSGDEDGKPFRSSAES